MSFRATRGLALWPEVGGLWPAFMGATALGCMGRFGLDAQAVVAASFAVVVIVLSRIDIERRIVPNRIVLPAAVGILAAQIALFPDRALEWTLSALFASLFFLAAHLVSPGGMGMGDVKLGLLLGVALGKSVATAIVLGLFAAAVAAVYLLARDGLAARRTAMPLVPYLAFGALIVVFLDGVELHFPG
jgi:prepilin signal peptidase PulO-like enzyme (type II secretory pathway)